jgi:peroxiredoxin
MAATPTDLNLGTEAPPFALPDVRTGKVVSSDDLTAGPLLVIWICNHCPYVKRVREGLVSLGKDYAGSPVDIVAISSNDAENYPDDSPEELARIADEVGYPFPVLFDETQQVAKAYGAVCTPDFFLFDADRLLVYRGQFDAARPGNEVDVTGVDLRAAIDAVLAGEPVPRDQTPPIGCSIKWKPGNEPAA